MPAAAAQVAARRSTTGRRRTLRHFLLSMLAAAVTVVAVGWFTNLRELAEAAMISVALFAFLPFVLIGFGLAIAMLAVVVSLIAAILGAGGGDTRGIDAGEPLIDAGLDIAPGYYGWLASRRHPVFWGIPLGVLLGGLSLWAMLAVLVLPGEAATAQTLAEVRADIERVYAETSRYPKPTPAGHLTWAALGRRERGDAVLDGFGRPLEYHVVGAWKVASYRLRSGGYDARPGGGDDFCLSGTTKLGRLASIVGWRKNGSDKWRDRFEKSLAGIQDLRCPE